MPETFRVENFGTPCNKENERKQCKFPSLGSRKSLERNTQTSTNCLHACIAIFQTKPY